MRIRHRYAASSVASVLAMFTLAGLVQSCGEGGIGPKRTAVAQVTLSQDVLQVTVGQSATLAAEVRDGAGNLLTDRTVFWSSKNPTVATVPPSSGVVTGVTAGTTEVAASVEGKSAIAQVTVSLIPVASVRVTPSSRALQAGATVQLLAEALGPAGQLLTGRGFTWTTSDATVATVSAAGLVSAVAPGAATITATSEGRSSVAAITVSAVPVATIRVSPTPDTLTAGQTRQFTATLLDAQGGVLTGRVVTWTTSAPAVATISSSGLLTALAAGNVTVTAAAEGKSASADVHVRAVPVSSILISPASATIAIGETAQFLVQTVDGAGNVLAGRVVAYRSTAPNVATVSASGAVTGVAVGTATIEVSSEGARNTIAITVIPLPVATIEIAPTTGAINVGATQAFTATLKSAVGQVLQGRQVTWLSGSPSVATVSPTGVATGVGAGTALIFATSEGRVASATLTVSGIAVASVALSPGGATLQQGGTAQFTASALDAQGNVLSGRVITWSSANDAVATITSTGRVTAVAVGATTIAATSEGKVGIASIVVNSIPAASVAISPSTASLTQGQTSQLTATVRDAQGNVLNGRAVTWTTNAGGVATISNTGLVTAVGAGSATITASSGGVNGTATVTVAQVPVASVTLAPPTATVQTLQQITLAATLRDANNNVLTGRPITWSSSNVAVATVTQAGVVRGVIPGAVTITATSGVSGTATVTVTVIPVNTVEVTLNSSAIDQGQSTQATAVTKDALGAVLTGRPVVWSSSSVSIAAVDQNGQVTGIGVGQATISATSEGKTGSKQITINAVPVATVTVNPASAQVQIGATTSLTAVTRDANGNVLTGRLVTWSSGDPTRATVSATGVVTGVAVGPVTITATSEGKTDNSNITVIPIPVALVRITPTSSNVVVGGTRNPSPFTAQAFDANNNVLPGRQITWSTANPSVASVPSTGVSVTGVNPGSTFIIASSEGKLDSSTVNVIPVPVISVQITPSAASRLVTQQQTFTASPRDSIGGAISPVPAVSWSTAPSAKATPTSANTAAITVTASDSGTVTLTATSGGQSANAILTIALVPVSTIAVTPNPMTTNVSWTDTLTAVPKDSAGGTLNRAVSWSTSDANIATVVTLANNRAAVTGVSAGTVNILAQAEGKTTTIPVTVGIAPINTITMTPEPLTLSGVTPTASVTASATDARGNAISGAAFTWSSANLTMFTVTPAAGATTSVSLVPGTPAGTYAIIVKVDAVLQGITTSRFLVINVP